MFQKIQITIAILLGVVSLALAQSEYNNFGGFNAASEFQDNDSLPSTENNRTKNIISIIKTWELKNYGALLEETKLDTALDFYQNYNPIYQESISNTFTGNLGGGYESNNFFKRKGQSDFYFYRNFDLYTILPEDVQYFNTTTPYTLLDYSQSNNQNVQNETRFNVFHSQNVNRKLNFSLIYDQSKATGQYRNQENKFHTIGLYSSYQGTKYVSHFNILFNRLRNQENGGLSDPNANLNEFKETDVFVVNLESAQYTLKNSTLFWNNEYRLGKTVEKEDSLGNVIKTFIPRTGFFYQVEFSGNGRTYNDEQANLDFYRNTYIDSTATNDTTIYNRFTNIFQLKFYEAPDRKFTFSKRAFIGHDFIRIKMPIDTALGKYKYSNVFVGGGISHEEGKFWKWGAQGKFYLTGYRLGQTELSAFIYKPMRLGKDTTSLMVSGNLNTIVPDYYEQKFKSNHYIWDNHFSNIKEMIIKSQIHSQKYRLSVGANYALTGNYIFNNEEALPQQAGHEMLVLSAYLNKDFVSQHWLVRTQVLWQKGSQESYLHLPDFCGYASLNWRTLWSKVMHTQIGVDVRYNTAFYADAYDAATGRYYWQNQKKIGNFPLVDVHANLKLKRTRVFFLWMNAASEFLNGDFWAAPNYPFYRRTFRLGVAWSFYD